MTDEAVTRVEVRLDPVTETDIDWITAACQDTEIQRWTFVPRPYHRHHAAEFVATGAGEFRTWAIRTATDLRPVGMIAIHSIDPKTQTADIGYWVAPWGRHIGAASGAIRLVVEEASHTTGVRFVEARIAITNVASRRTVESCGFVFVEESSKVTCPDADRAVNAAIYRLSL